MVFTIDDAFKIKDHYNSIVTGQPLDVSVGNMKVSGLFVCHNGNVQKAVEIMLRTNFDETKHMISDNGKKDYQVFAYHWNGSDIYHSELDKLLERSSISKIYSPEGEITETVF